MLVLGVILILNLGLAQGQNQSQSGGQECPPHMGQSRATDSPRAFALSLASPDFDVYIPAFLQSFRLTAAHDRSFFLTVPTRSNSTARSRYAPDTILISFKIAGNPYGQPSSSCSGVSSKC